MSTELLQDILTQTQLSSLFVFLKLSFFFNSCLQGGSRA